MTNYDPENYSPENYTIARMNAQTRQIALIRAVFGPVMLTIIGAMFVVDYSGGPSIGKTWPVLVIAAGLLKLAEFLGGRNL
jgi:hypothetical protein